MKESLRRPTFIKTGDELVVALQTQQHVHASNDYREYQEKWLNLFTPPAMHARVNDFVRSARVLGTVRVHQFEGLTPDNSERVYRPVDSPAEATQFTTQATFFGFLYTAEVEKVTASEGVVAIRARYVPLGRGEFRIKPLGIMNPEYRLKLERQYFDPIISMKRHQTIELTRFRGNVDKIDYYVFTDNPETQSSSSYEEEKFIGAPHYADWLQRHLVGVFGI